MNGRAKLNRMQTELVVRRMLLGVETPTEIAKHFGIARSRVYQILDDYTDPKKLSKLEQEVEFRRWAAAQAKEANESI